jgi:hypothetical protein
LVVDEQAVVCFSPALHDAKHGVHDEAPWVAEKDKAEQGWQLYAPCVVFIYLPVGQPMQSSSMPSPLVSRPVHTTACVVQGKITRTTNVHATMRNKELVKYIVINLLLVELLNLLLNKFYFF